MKFRAVVWMCALSLLAFRCPAQVVDSSITRAIAAAVLLDSVVITATTHGFDVEDFIRLVQEDQSLFRAFRNIRGAGHRFDMEMEFLDKHGKVKARYQSNNIQTVDAGCRNMTTIDEQTSGNFYKGRKRKFRYYTAQLYDRIFVTHGTVCTPEVDTSMLVLPDDADKTDGHVGELKKLIFTPGRPSKVPLIGKKTEIFSEKMLPLYDFAIRSGDYHGIPVYIFEGRVKEEFRNKQGKTVFRELITYFSKSDFQVLARRYHLSHKNAVFMFDVHMKVDLERIHGRYYPTTVQYEGTWNIPSKRRETGRFTVHLRDFR